MGKITIKHYLNTKISPSIIDEDDVAFSLLTKSTGSGKTNEYYPLYVQITQNRKTTQIKSLTDAKLTISGFQTFKETNNYAPKEGYCTNSEDGLKSIIRLVKPINEIKLIKLCYEYYQKINRQLDDKDTYTSLSARLLKLMQSVADTLLESAWLMIPHQEHLLNAFNQNFSIFDSANIIKQVCNVDICNYISPKVLMMFRSVNGLSKLFGDNVTFIEFISSDFEDKVQSMNSPDETKRIYTYYAKFLINAFFGSYIYSENELQSLTKSISRNLFF